ncbi:hypothetical protein ILUMI_02330 [Ignelater luminosus]|uniref:LITAF domain-containing protein n=1 Tax=Ignelater luminosus TaxID=2038154 RepID=A0A8K0DIC0_IGNLU|nr:hypothetical protein ILUMI_02330 [Ignelater luminosus]
MSKEKEELSTYTAATAPETESHAPPPNQAAPPQVYPQLPSGTDVYVAPAQQGTTVVVTSPPPFHHFGPVPQAMTCPHCHNNITTKIQAVAGMKTHLFALALCIFLCIPCCLIPYCIDSCKTRNHYCSSCGTYLGTYNDTTGMRRNYW